MWAAWGGITGIQTLVPLMLTEGVLERGLSLERFTALMSTNPAKIAGLWPRKGEIRIGADADLLLVDLQRAWRVEPSWLYSRHPQSPFIGRKMTAWIERVLLRGRTIALEGRIAGDPGGLWVRPPAAECRNSLHCQPNKDLQ